MENISGNQHASYTACSGFFLTLSSKYAFQLWLLRERRALHNLHYKKQENSFPFSNRKLCYNIEYSLLSHMHPFLFLLSYDLLTLPPNPNLLS